MTNPKLAPYDEYIKLISSDWFNNPDLVANSARKILECIFICLLTEHDIPIPKAPQLSTLNKSLKKTPVKIPSQVEISFGTVWRMGNDGSHYRTASISQTEAMTCFSALYTCVEWYTHTYLERPELPLPSPKELIQKRNSIAGYKAILSKSIEDGVISLDEAEILHHYRENNNLQLNDIEDLHKDMHYTEMCRKGLQQLIQEEANQFGEDISQLLLRFFEVTSLEQTDINDLLESHATKTHPSSGSKSPSTAFNPQYLTLGLVLCIAIGLFYTQTHPTQIVGSITTAVPTESANNLLGQVVCRTPDQRIHTTNIDFYLPDMKRLHAVRLIDDDIEVLTTLNNTVSIVRIPLASEKAAPCLWSEAPNLSAGKISFGDLNNDGFTDIMTTRSGTLPFGEDSKLDCSNIVSATNTQFLISTPLLDINSDISGRADLPLCQNRGLFKYNNMLGDAWGLEVVNGSIVDMDEDGDLDILLGDQFSLSHQVLCNCEAEATNEETCLKDALAPAEWQQSVNPFAYGRIGIFDDYLKRESPHQHLTLRSDGGILIGELNGEVGKDLLVIKDPTKYEAWLATSTTEGEMVWQHQGRQVETHYITEMYDKIKPSTLVDVNGDGLDDLVYYNDTHMGLKWIPNQMNIDTNPGLFFQKRKQLLFETTKPIKTFKGTNIVSNTGHQKYFDTLCQSKYEKATAQSFVLYLQQ